MSSPLKLAIIGGGPSAFYVASRLLHLLPRTPELRIHIYDRLWAPHGLVRYGVAPDHPEVKNCTHKFDTAASDPRVRFFGNVHLSAHASPYPTPRPSNTAWDRRVFLSGQGTGHALPVSLATLFPYYTHLVFATGAPRPRLHPLLALSNVCIPALDIVHWYTMHPGSSYPPSTTNTEGTCPIPPKTRHLTLIGHGNVSLDIARLLLTHPSNLETLDIPGHVLCNLNDIWNDLQHVSIIGRRGPGQVRFTAKEVREMMTLKEARMNEIPRNVMEGGMESQGKGRSRREERVLKLLKEGSVGAREGDESSKSFSIDFWRSPTGYTLLPYSTSTANRSPRVLLTMEKTRLDAETGGAMGTGVSETLKTDLIVTSLGYEGEAEMFGLGGVLASHSESTRDSLPWYVPSLGHMRTQGGGGRVLTPQGGIVNKVYAAGWAAHNATGVLAGTLLDAGDVAGAIVQDWSAGVGGETKGCSDPLGHGWDVAGGLEGLAPAVEAGLEEGMVLEYEGWRRVEEEERRRGGGVKERERMGWDDVTRFLGNKLLR